MALHPLNTEPLDYTSARSAVLTAVFYLAAFDAGVRRRRALCLLLFACALLTKVIAISLPLALVGYWLLARERTPERAAGLMPAWFAAALVSLAVAGVCLPVLPPSAPSVHRGPPGDDDPVDATS